MPLSGSGYYSDYFNDGPDGPGNNYGGTGFPDTGARQPNYTTGPGDTYDRQVSSTGENIPLSVHPIEAQPIGVQPAENIPLSTHPIDAQPLNQNTNEFVFPKGEDVKPYSGLPESYRDQLLSFLMPQLQGSVQNMEGNIDDYTQSALGTYQQEFDQYIQDVIPKQLRSLSQRGVLDSSFAENALSQTYSDALRKSSGMGYQTAMEAARMKTQIPQTVGNLLQYGQYSEDPTVMYKTLAGLLANMMP
jgi:hypothetical protein